MPRRKPYRIIGVSEATYQQLVAYRDTLLRAYDQGRIDLPGRQVDRSAPSWNYTLARMAAEAMDKRKRSNGTKKRADEISDECLKPAS